MKKKKAFKWIECYFFLVFSEKGNTLTVKLCFLSMAWNIIIVLIYLFLVLPMLYNSEQN